MQCHANKFQTVSNLLVQVLCLDAVCLDSKPSKPLIKQHIAAYLQKYLRDFGCHSSHANSRLGEQNLGPREPLLCHVSTILVSTCCACLINATDFPKMMARQFEH